MNSKSTRFLALLGVLAVAACGDDDPTGTVDLTEAEAQQLATAVLTTALTAFAQVPQQPAALVDGPAMAPFEYANTWEGTVECAGGGTVSVQASVTSSGDTETGEAVVDMELTQVHSNCVVQSGAQPFTFTGNPSVVVEIMYESDGEGTVSYDGSITGALDFDFDGSSGTCTIDYNYMGTVNANTGSGSYSLTGSVCGTSMNWQYNVG